MALLFTDETKKGLLLACAARVWVNRLRRCEKHACAHVAVHDQTGKKPRDLNRAEGPGTSVCVCGRHLFTGRNKIKETRKEKTPPGSRAELLERKFDGKCFLPARLEPGHGYATVPCVTRNV